MCCTGAKWKREVVQDHKFDFVDVKEYHTTGPITRLRYALVYVFVIKSVLVYVSDIYTAIAMLAHNYWSGNILSASANSSTIKVPFTIGKWIFTGCIIFSFLLLAWESRKARMIIRSRDISYAFTNVMANNYYTLKSYNHFCFFSQINNSKKKKDEFAFFVFFTFKGWKRLLLADAPRQVINGLTLYSFGKAFNFTTDVSKYYSNTDGSFSIVRLGILCTMIFTVVIWCGSAILLAIAAFMYIPLLCYIQGNLKEYCCHKIDKRIAELMKRRTKKRLAREAELAKREAAGDFRHLQDKQGRFKDGHAPLPQPTLPTIDLADDELYGDAKSEAARSNYRGGSKKGAGGDTYAYPPMPPMPDLAYAGYPESQNSQPRYQLNDIAEDASYSLSHPNYPYPSNMHLPTDSFASLVNDDKASIRSKDPLLYAGLGMGGIADQSQVSLNRAPSYKTQEDDAGQITFNFGQAYQDNESQLGYSPQMHHQEEMDSRRRYVAGPASYGGYAEAPSGSGHYGLEQRDSYGFGQQQSQNSSSSNNQHASSSRHSSRSQSPVYTSQSQGQSQLHTRDLSSQSYLQSNHNPTARGVSVAGRSDVTTFYYMEDRDRASMADSHAGAFDLDDYARRSMFTNSQQLNSHSHWQLQQQALGPGQGQMHGQGRLGYLEEEAEDETLQFQQGYPQQHSDQRDWRP